MHLNARLACGLHVRVLRVSVMDWHIRKGVVNAKTALRPGDCAWRLSPKPQQMLPLQSPHNRLDWLRPVKLFFFYHKKKHETEHFLRLWSLQQVCFEVYDHCLVRDLFQAKFIPLISCLMLSGMWFSIQLFNIWLKKTPCEQVQKMICLNHMSTESSKFSYAFQHVSDRQWFIIYSKLKIVPKVYYYIQAFSRSFYPKQLTIEGPRNSSQSQ